MTSPVLDRQQQSTRRWHPATEIVVLGCMLLLVFGIPSPAVPILVIGATTIAVVFSPRASAATWLSGVATVCLPTLIVVTIVQGLFYPGEDVRVLWGFGPAQLTIEGLAIAIQIWLRVTALVALCAFFGLGTDSARLFDGLRALRAPASVAYVCASTIGLIPLIRTRTRQILDARASRGWAVDRWSVRIRLVPTIVSTLFTSALVEAEQRHDVLEQRGLGDSHHVVPLQDHSDSAGQRLMRRGGPVLTCIIVVGSLAGVLPLPSAADMIGGA